MTTTFFKLSCMGAADMSVPPLTQELQHAVRDIPEKATGTDLVDFLKRCLALAERQATAAKGLLSFGSRAGDASRAALKAAIAEPKKVGIEDLKKVYAPGSEARAAVVRVGTIAVAEQSANFGRAKTKTQAFHGLVRDLTTKPKLLNIPTPGPLTVALILGAGYAVARMAVK